MSTTLSVRIDPDTKKRLEALAKRARRTKSFLAAEAIAAFVEAESWQLDEIQAGLTELDEGRGVAHKEVAAWLRS
jgi:RHH-type transcriptional regulator, rel operon repressor / antitoxin RelB